LFGDEVAFRIAGASEERWRASMAKNFAWKLNGLQAPDLMVLVEMLDGLLHVLRRVIVSRFGSDGGKLRQPSRRWAIDRSVLSHGLNPTDSDRIKCVCVAALVIQVAI
jgi:hypothetical protein